MPHNVQSSLLEYLLTDSFILMRNFFRVLDKLWTECWILLLYDFHQMHQAFMNHLFFQQYFCWVKCAALLLPSSSSSSVAGRVTYSSPMWNFLPLSGIFMCYKPEPPVCSVSPQWTCNLTANLHSRSRYSTLLLLDCLCCRVTFFWNSVVTVLLQAPFECFCIMFGADWLVKMWLLCSCIGTCQESMLWFQRKILVSLCWLSLRGSGLRCKCIQLLCRHDRFFLCSNYHKLVFSCVFWGRSSLISDSTENYYELYGGFSWSFWFIDAHIDHHQLLIVQMAEDWGCFMIAKCGPNHRINA